MGQAFLTLIDVTKRLGDRTILDRISLDAAEGAVVALLGASGSGKTTTLRIAAGLDTPDEGEVWIAGECVAAGRRNLLPPSARRVGFVFQDLALWPHFTVAASLDFVLASAKVPKRERAKRIADTLGLVRIERSAGSYPYQLSGGEQQRAALARALVGSPRLLLLDEPMSSLDQHLKAQLLTELAALQRRLGITTIYITHDKTEAAAITDRVVVIHEGRVEPGGTAQMSRLQPVCEPSLR
ncbi:MAG TPA: ABC transporter ATP-binding protein [Blastocatellia bacterium]|nr:ABC transporter ATP-binding protein [Blastocatellia bacterium]